MSNKQTITLADKNAVYNFEIGYPIAWPRWYHRAWWHNLLSRITWWRNNRGRVVAIDRDAGIVTIESMRWSWRKWKWVSP